MQAVCFEHEHIKKAAALIPEMSDKVGLIYDAISGTPDKPGHRERLEAVERVCKWLVGTLIMGSIITIACLVFQHFGLTHDASVEMCTNIMMGIGGVTALVGFIHKLIKDAKIKNVALPQTTITIGTKA